MKNKIISAIILTFAVFFAITCFSVNAEGYSGSCGSGVFWNLDTETGLLTINGNGKMKSFSSSSTPWNAYSADIKSVVVENGVTNISSSAFKDCRELLYVKLPSTVTEIGSYAFHSCTKLISVTGLDSVTSVGTGAFYACSSLKSISLPKATELGGYALSYCSSLEILEAPNLTSVGIDTFAGCKLLIEEKKGIYFVGDWVIGCRDGITDLIVPEGTRGIAGRAFAKRTSIVTATLPDSVGNRIGGECFYGCTSLETLTMPMYFTLCTTEEGYIGGADRTYYYFFHIGTFFGFNSSFPDSICVPEAFHVYAIAEPYCWYSPKQTGNMFYIPRSLKEIIITSGNMLTYANIYGPNGEIYESEYYDNYLDVELNREFLDWSYNGSTNTLIINGGGRMPDYEEGKAPWAEYSSKIKHVKISGLKSIGTNAFYGCYYIEDVTFDEKLTDISKAAFYYCTKLKSFDFTNIKTIGKYAFSHCKALKEVDLTNVDRVDAAAFEGCSSIESITFPSEGTVAEYVFSGCTSLENLFIEKVGFVLGKGVFRNCTSLENIIFYAAEPTSWNSAWLEGCSAKAHYESVWHTIDTRHCHKCSDPSCIIEEPHSFNDEGTCTFCGYGKSGFVTIEGGTVYYENGVIKTGWFYVGDMLCYAFEDTGFIVSYNCYIGGKFYVWNDEAGLSVADGFIHNGTGYRCYENGIQVIGWRHKDGSGPSVVDGIYEQYSQNPNELYYFLSTTGYMVTDSTYKLGGFVREFNDDHTVKPVNGPQTVSGEFYYYVDGVKQTGWHEINGLTYYFRASDAVYGRAATKWMYISNKIYYFYASTSADPYALKTSGKIGGIEYTYSESGQILYNGFVNCDYANKINSNTAANIQKMNGTTRYYVNGEMQTGWQDIGGNRYYFYAIGSANGSGYMCVTSRYIGGVWYEFTEDGKCINDACVRNGHTWQVATCTDPKICTVCGATEGKGEHSYIDGECVVCHKLESEGLKFTLNSDNASYKVSVGTCADKDIVVPKYYKGYPVTELDVYAFAGCGGLESINLPDSITFIGNNAFESCVKLTDINIPYGIVWIENYTFLNCTALKTITVPNSVKHIGSFAFWNCTELTSVILPNSLISFSSSGVFENCISLTSIKIPDSVEYIGNNTFEDCIGLTSIIIPSSVTYIGTRVFGDCTELKTIYCEATSEAVGHYGSHWLAGCSATVYWGDQWHYVDGVPTLK